MAGSTEPWWRPREGHFSAGASGFPSGEAPECLLRMPFPGPLSIATVRGSLMWNWRTCSDYNHLAALITPKLESQRPKRPQAVSEQEENKEAQEAGVSNSPSSSLPGAKLSPRHRPDTSYMATPHGLAFCREGGRVPFVFLGVQKVCVCLFRTKPILNWYKWNRFYK